MQNKHELLYHATCQSVCFNWVDLNPSQSPDKLANTTITISTHDNYSFKVKVFGCGKKKKKKGGQNCSWK